MSRSGSHLHLRRRIYYYRRDVPTALQAAIGHRIVWKSLATSNLNEARRLEKIEDIAFEARVDAAKQATDPRLFAERAGKAVKTTVHVKSVMRGGLGFGGAVHRSQLTLEQRATAAALFHEHFERMKNHGAEVNRLLGEIVRALPDVPLPDEVWQACRTDIVSLIRSRLINTQQAPDPEHHSLDQAFEQWRRTQRKPDSIDTGRRHLERFKKHSELWLLSQVRRRHLVAWRDSLIDEGSRGRTTINQHLQMVMAILRVGWRNAEIAEPDLKKVLLPIDKDDNDRMGWTADELLTALNRLQPNSGMAWIFLLALTTGARLGEPAAARRDWYDPAGFINVPASATKASKPHVLPIVSYLREPLAAHVATVPDHDYLFDIRRVTNLEKYGASHKVSDDFRECFRAWGINRTFHELRDTWIEAARHSRYSRDKWEIISGHSNKTVSDRYGGKRATYIAKMNEKICRYLTTDHDKMPAVLTAMLRLVQR